MGRGIVGRVKISIEADPILSRRDIAHDQKLRWCFDGRILNFGGGSHDAVDITTHAQGKLAWICQTPIVDAE